MKKEKNRLLEVATKSIPYIKELKQLPNVKSTNACILFQQIEYWFHIKPNSFYKFQAPPSSIQYAYKVGDSWTEELGLSEDEFRTSFKQIGISYSSKKNYDSARLNEDVFQGKYYCSYFDKISRLTHYFRNDRLVDDAINLVAGWNLETDNPNSSESAMSTPREGDTGALESDIVSSESTENTTKNTHDIYKEREALSDNKADLEGELESEEDWDVSQEEPTSNVEESCPAAESETKEVVSSYFEPSLDARFRAVLAFPQKHQGFATEKFINHFRAKHVKKTASQWEDEWWNWMSKEFPSPGNDLIDSEHNKITNQVCNLVLNIFDECPRYVVGVDYMVEIIEVAAEEEENLSKASIKGALEILVNCGQLVETEGYYFDLHEYRTNEKWRQKVDSVLDEIEIPNPVRTETNS